MNRAAVAIVALLALVGGACEREKRAFNGKTAADAHPDLVRLTSLEPGGVQSAHMARSPYHDNAYGISEGKRLFSAFNCNGCHAAGGGGIGPPLMDDQWIYGYYPDQIFSTIMQGRPDGMPAFGGRIPEDQVWQIVSYIESLSARTPRDAATSRADDMSVMRPEVRLERLRATQTGHR